MIKRISWFGPATLAGAVGLVCLLHAIAEAGTYKLEYPANYGCKCTPNVQGIGFFRTTWREWPGEARPDKHFPDSIGREVLPTPKGYEQLPLPRTKVQPEGPGNLPPGGTGTPGNIEITPPGRGEILPGLAPEPGGTLPGLSPEPGRGGTLPGLSPEPNGFNPTPGLPPELDMPGTLEKPDTKPTEPPADAPAQLDKTKSNLLEPPQEKKSDVKAGSDLKVKPQPSKKDSSNRPLPKRNAESNEIKSNSPMRLPNTLPAMRTPAHLEASNQARPEANWDSALQPGTHPETSRSVFSPSLEEARQANYQAPVGSNANAETSLEVVQQSYQQANLPAKAAADLRQSEVPPMAINGYCPVELCRNGRWVQGDPRWTVVHKGKIYRLSGNDQRREFLANPEQFAPGNEGNDAVISAIEMRSVPGDLNYCAAFKGRIFMFSSSATQAEFQKNPERFMSGK